MERTEKHLYLIGGAMGVGKSRVSGILKKRLPDSVFLDGDWCWDMDPFQVTEETKKMVMDNICFLLNQFIACSAYKSVVFCWVMHEQAIWNEILSRLNTTDCKIHRISLICRPEILEERLKRDIEAGLRTEDVIPRSIERAGHYGALDTEKLDVSDLTPEEAAERIMAMASSDLRR